MKSLIKIALIIGIVVLNHPNLFAQELYPSEQPAPVANALFGQASAISGDWALVAAPQEDVNDKQSTGAAYFYKMTEQGWEIAQKVSPEGAASFSLFGNSVAIQGNTAFVGAVGDRTNGMFSGAVYVYTLTDTTWAQTDKLTPTDGKIGHRFGNALGVSDSTLIVGAYQAEGNTQKTGAVYVFKNTENGWNQTQKIYAANGEANDYYGYTVESINPSYFAVGAYNATGAAERSGAVFIYKKGENEFEENAVMFEMDGSSSDLFGYSIEYGCVAPIVVKSAGTNLSCNEFQDFPELNDFSQGDHFLFIGAPGTNNQNGQTGSVFFYRLGNSGISYNYAIEEDASSPNDHFGTSLSFYESVILIGANRTNSASNTNTGSVYKYVAGESEFFNLGQFAETTTQKSSYFGTSISSSGKNIIITAPYTANEETENSGSAYFYREPATSVEDETVSEIINYSLNQNYPNPFNPTTTIEYSVKEAGLVKITVYNLLGQVVQTLVNEQKPSGLHQVIFNASNLSSGAYFYRLEVNDFVQNKRMMLIK